MVWTIEAKIFPIQYGFTLGSHLYIEIFDDAGNRVLQINGLAAIRETGEFKPDGDPSNQLMSNVSTEPDDFYIGTSQFATRDNYPYDGEVIFSGTEAQINEAINQIVAATDYINNQNYSYGLLTFNSNTVFSGLIQAMSQAVSIDQQAVQNVINSAFNPVAVNADPNIFHDNLWQINPDDPDDVGSIVQNDSTIFPNGLKGSSGDDQLFGLDGKDILIGRAGNDLLNGGDDFDTADYSDKAEKPDGTEKTLALNPTFDEITVVLGDFSAENIDFKIVDRYGNIDSLVSIEKVVGQAGAENTISVLGSGLLHQTAPNTYEFDGHGVFRFLLLVTDVFRKVFLSVLSDRCPTGIGL